jgi:hypothetical protein
MSDSSKPCVSKAGKRIHVWNNLGSGASRKQYKTSRKEKEIKEVKRKRGK